MATKYRVRMVFEYTAEYEAASFEEAQRQNDVRKQCLMGDNPHFELIEIEYRRHDEDETD